jgi:hypothetical protein
VNQQGGETVMPGRGLSVESIMADDLVAAKSERAVRCLASRLGIGLGAGNPFSLPPAIWRELEDHAAYRGCDGVALAFEILYRVLREHLVDAVLDDQEK